MYDLVIWDKKSSINGMKAETFLQQNLYLVNDEVILLKKNGVIVGVEGKSILCNNYGFDINLSALEVGQLYLEKLENPEPIPPVETEADKKIRELEEKQVLMQQAIDDLILGGAL